MTETTMIQALSTDYLQELLHSMGFRVTVSEREGQRQLWSAAQGLGFAVRPGNPAKTDGEFIDCTFHCALRVRGELPTGLINSWNMGKRFSRLSFQGEFLVLEKDVIATGGVSQNHLRAMVQLWDRLLQELVIFLRSYAPSHASTTLTTSTSTSTSMEQGEASPSAHAALSAPSETAMGVLQ